MTEDRRYLRVSYEKINKRKARKLYNRGHVIFLLPCRVSQVALHGGNMFVQPFSISLTKVYRDFDRLVNEYEYYNCIDTTIGKHASFYIETKELEKSNMCDLMCN